MRMRPFLPIETEGWIAHVHDRTDIRSQNCHDRFDTTDVCQELQGPVG